jgi:hypothetical protein
MAFVRINAISPLINQRLTSIAAPRLSKSTHLVSESMDTVQGGGSSGEPIKKEISFQQYTDEFVKRGKLLFSLYIAVE